MAKRQFNSKSEAYETIMKSAANVRAELDKLTDALLYMYKNDEVAYDDALNMARVLNDAKNTTYRIEDIANPEAEISDSPLEDVANTLNVCCGFEVENKTENFISMVRNKNEMVNIHLYSKEIIVSIPLGETYKAQLKTASIENLTSILVEALRQEEI